MRFCLYCLGTPTVQSRTNRSQGPQSFCTSGRSTSSIGSSTQRSSSPSHTGHRAGDHRPVPGAQVPCVLSTGTIFAPRSRMPTFSPWSSLTSPSLRSPTLSSSTRAPSRSRHLPNPQGDTDPSSCCHSCVDSRSRRPSPPRNHPSRQRLVRFSTGWAAGMEPTR